MWCDCPCFQVVSATPRSSMRMEQPSREMHAPCLWLAIDGARGRLHAAHALLDVMQHASFSLRACGKHDLLPSSAGGEKLFYCSQQRLSSPLLLHACFPPADDPASSAVIQPSTSFSRAPRMDEELTITDTQAAHLLFSTAAHASGTGSTAFQEALPPTSVSGQ